MCDVVAVVQSFIREGCLQKLSRKGYQQRIFFLVSLTSKQKLYREDVLHLRQF